MSALLNKMNVYYTTHNGWWLPLLAGVPFMFCLPPFNHELHFVFSVFPFLSFVVLIPFFSFSLGKKKGKAILHTFLYSYIIALGQCFWVAFVKIEGLWGLIIFSMFLLAGFVAVFYLAAGLIFRWCYRMFPRSYPVIFPAFWVLIDYSRTLGELAFPWAFLGYNFTPIVPISRLASITGVWGLTYLILVGNLLLRDILVAYGKKQTTLRLRVIRGVLFTACIGGIAVWGWIRAPKTSKDLPTAKIALIQPGINQLNYASGSLDTSFAIIDSLVYGAARSKPDFIIGPESALLCYLSRQNIYRNRFQRWADSTNIPLLMGALHWDKAPGGSVYDYLVYNAAFLAHPDKKELSLYRKIKLVPFSEAFPFETGFPILSRVNLGEADFKRGKDEVVYEVTTTIKAAPFVCYEIIFPDFVRRRLRNSANLIVHMTNDGWFGRTTGPYQHAMMSRMRAIEHNMPIARCAITGLSMFIDPCGRVTKQTRLNEKITIEENVVLKSADTIYSTFGDWFVVGCAIICIMGIIASVFRIKRN